VLLVVVSELSVLWFFSGASYVFVVDLVVTEPRDGWELCPRASRFDVMSGDDVDEGRGSRCDLRASIKA
jgi:hypothetical protein